MLNKGLGSGLTARDCLVTGREIRGDFAKLPFDEQIALIRQDLCGLFSAKDRVIANSFGAYLLLHALAELPPFEGRLLILSPILGEVSTNSQRMMLVPPKAATLWRCVEEGRFPVPRRCQIHVGSQDWQINPKAAQLFAESLSIPIIFAEGRGHMLGEDYVGPLLDQWLRDDA